MPRQCGQRPFLVEVVFEVDEEDFVVFDFVEVEDAFGFATPIFTYPQSSSTRTKLSRSAADGNPVTTASKLRPSRRQDAATQNPARFVNPVLMPFTPGAAVFAPESKLLWF